ncbi:MAG: acyl carrier protein [Acetobacteraceae bacterium]|nr:acyl carrier protein [Acetobacteraceae bacterium]
MLTGPTAPQIVAIVHDRIRAMLADRFGEDRSFSGSDRLNETLGLTSLDLAELVVTLEDRFGVDPFAKLVPITDVQTVDDLARAYQIGLSSQASPPLAPDAGFEAARQRGARRRIRPP